MKNMIRSLPDCLLILLYVYAAFSKLLDFDTFSGQLYNQPFPHELAGVLRYALPASELLAVILILWRRYWGLALSLWLLVLFTGYIGLVLLHFWPRVPCSCGGILSHLGWRAHLFFNLFFIAINVLAIRQTGEAENPVQSRRNPSI